MKNKQFLLTFIPNNKKKKLHTNDNKLLEMTDEANKKIGSALNIHDILFSLKKEQELFIPLISEIYGIKFNIEVHSIGTVISQTSLKCLLVDENRIKYFLKQKPFYSIENQKIAYDFQNYLSDNTKFTPSIIKTLNGNNYYFLTLNDSNFDNLNFANVLFN